MVLLVVLAAVPARGQTDEEIIRGRDAAFGVSVAKVDRESLWNLVARDVRFVRRDSIVFGVESAELRLPSLFGLKPDGWFTRTLETLRVSASGDLAVAMGTNTVADAVRSASQRFLTLWRRNPEAEWRVAADGPLESWRGLEQTLVLRQPPNSGGLVSVELNAPGVVEQLEPGTLRPSASHDLAYCVGEYVVATRESSDPSVATYGFFLAVWEMTPEGWRLIAASFPEPHGRVTR